jgi:hypothetical protein
MKCCKSSPQRFDFSFSRQRQFAMPTACNRRDVCIPRAAWQAILPCFQVSQYRRSKHTTIIPDSHIHPHNPRILTCTSNLETLFPSPQPHLSLSRLQNHQNDPLTLQQQKLKVLEGEKYGYKDREKEKQIGTSVTRHLKCRAKSAGYQTN